MSSNDPHDRLDSWKAIAAYLRRTEKTARRWERNEGLPVHRLSHQDRSSVYAFKDELDAWRSTRSVEAHVANVDEPASTGRRTQFMLIAVLVTVVAGLGGYELWRAFRAPDPSPVTLAVLPFTSSPEDADSSHVGPAIAEILVNHLADAPDLQVRPFASSLRHYSRQDEPAAIGMRMGVDTIVTGQVDTAGGDLTIKVALVDVEANTQIWGTAFDTTYGELGPLQERIARMLREQSLRYRHGADYPLVEFPSGRQLSTNPQAVRHYLRGLGFRPGFSRPQIQYAIDQFQSAVQLDPDFAAAHSALAVAYVDYSFLAERSAMDTMNLAKTHALSAAALDPRSAGGHRVLAAVSHWFDFDQVLAEQQFRTAIATAPGDAGAWNWQAEFFIDMGRFDEALEANREAAERDPGWLSTDIVRGNAFLYGGRPEEAVLIYRQALKISPNNGYMRYFLGQAYLVTNRPSEAVTELQRANEDIGSAPFSMAALAYSLGRAGRRAEAEEMLRDFERRRQAGYYPAFALAMAHIGLGNDEQALDLLERAVEERSMGFYMPSVERAWDPLRGQPRFQRLLRRLGLPDTIRAMTPISSAAAT